MRERRARRPIVPTRARSTRRSRLTSSPARRHAHAARLRDVLGDPAVEDGDAPGGARRDLAFVGDQHDRPAPLVEVGEEADDRVAGAAVEVAGRFVGEDDRRVADEGAGDGDALALAARQRAGTVQRPRRRGRPRRARPAPARRRRRRGTPAYSSPSATFSSAVSRSTRWNCWNTNPMRRPRTAVRRRSPSG